MCCCALLLELELQALRMSMDGGASVAPPNDPDIAADQGRAATIGLGYRWLLRLCFRAVAVFLRKASEGVR